MNVAVFDGSMINLAVQNGWKGVVVVNGCITNTNGVQQVQFGIIAIGSCNSRGYQNLGQRGVTLLFGNVNFTPGSWIYADQVRFRKAFCHDVLCKVWCCGKSD